MFENSSYLQFILGVRIGGYGHLVFVAHLRRTSVLHPPNIIRFVQQNDPLVRGFSAKEH